MSHVTCYMSYTSYVICHMSHFTIHMPYAICHMPYAICHLQYAICHMSNVICHMSYVICRHEKTYKHADNLSRSCGHLFSNKRTAKLLNMSGVKSKPRLKLVPAPLSVLPFTFASLNLFVIITCESNINSLLFDKHCSRDNCVDPMIKFVSLKIVSL